MAKKDPVISTQIKLNIALGVTEMTTDEEYSANWVEWSKKYPKEKATLSPAVIASLNSLVAIIKVENAIKNIPPTIVTVVTAVKDAYDIALSLVPGVGSANGAKLAVNISMEAVKKKLEDALAKLKDIPPTIWKQLTNIEVDENATL